jgi:hypothetical protein
MRCHPDKPGNHAVSDVDFRAKIGLRQPTDRFTITKDHELPRVFHHRIPPPAHLIQKCVAPDITFNIPHLSPNNLTSPRGTRIEKLGKELLW